MDLVKQSTLVLLVVSLVGCSGASPKEEPKAQGADFSEAAAAASQRPAMVPDPSWVAARVSKAKARLSSDEAGKLVWASIEAHGGLAGWFERGPLQFRFNYRPKAAGKKARDTRQIIDTWSSRARHELSEDASVSFGWDGKRAWLKGSEEDTHKARFWSLTPYYFIAIPFVLADDGVNLRALGATELEGRAYDLVKVTYGEGVGDSPQDFYVVYIDKESKRVGGVRYIVSYPGFFPDGGHSPEKLMTYDGEQRIDGMLFPKTFRTFKWVEGKAGELVTETTLSEVSFEPDTDRARFEVPEGAKILEGW